MSGRVLVIDTCGEGAGVALALDGQLRQAALPRQGASSEIVAAVRGLLEEGGVALAELAAVGVVAGPGSFTGVRAGLAAAKGLCEAGGVRMVPVSRLDVLADMGGTADGVAALDAGRGQLYLRRQQERQVRQWLGVADEVRSMDAGVVVVAQENVAALLHGVEVLLRPLCAGDALPTVMRAMDGAAVDAAMVDALYLREEADIYQKPGGANR